MSLTDEQLDALVPTEVFGWALGIGGMKDALREYARAVAEAAVRAEREGQEPVAWRFGNTDTVRLSKPVTPYIDSWIPLYTTPPAAHVPDQWLPILEAVMREMPRGSGRNGNAPGHGHDVPGIWDSDNGDLAGKPCAWCLAWNTARAMIAASKQEGA